MLLGYIVSDKNIDIENLICVNKIPENKNIPKLIVGRDFIKKLNIKTSILSKKIDNNTFWTYSSKEKKSEYLEDLEKFKKYCVDTFIKKITYYYIDPFSLKYSQIKKIIKKFKTNKTGLFYYDTNMCYIFFDELIFGIHWNTMDYIGMSKTKIIDYLKLNNFSALPKDEIFNRCMVESQVLNSIKIIPYLYYSKVHDKQDLVGNIR